MSKKALAAALAVALFLMIGFQTFTPVEPTPQPDGDGGTARNPDTVINVPSGAEWWAGAVLSLVGVFGYVIKKGVDNQIQKQELERGARREKDKADLEYRFQQLTVDNEQSKALAGAITQLSGIMQGVMTQVLHSLEDANKGRERIEAGVTDNAHRVVELEGWLKGQVAGNADAAKVFYTKLDTLQVEVLKAIAANPPPLTKEAFDVTMRAYQDQIAELLTSLNLLVRDAKSNAEQAAYAAGAADVVGTAIEKNTGDTANNTRQALDVAKAADKKRTVDGGGE